MSSLHLTAAQWRTSKVQLIEWAIDTLDMHARMCMCTYTPHMCIWTLLISKDPAGPVQGMEHRSVSVEPCIMPTLVCSSGYGCVVQIC